PHDLRRPVAAQWKPRASQLILLEAAQEISLVLAAVHAAAHFPASALGIPIDPRVVPGSDLARPDALRHFEKLVELDEVVAQRTRDGRAAGQIFIDERLHHLRLKALF